jgi:hypothetical protein
VTKPTGPQGRAETDDVGLPTGKASDAVNDAKTSMATETEPGSSHDERSEARNGKPRPADVSRENAEAPEEARATPAESAGPPPPWQRAGHNRPAGDDRDAPNGVLRSFTESPTVAIPPAPREAPSAPREAPPAPGSASRGGAEPAEANEPDAGRRERGDQPGRGGRGRARPQRTGGDGPALPGGLGGSFPTSWPRNRRPRQASLQLKRLDPWSVLKVALVLSVVLYLVWLVAVGVLYGVLDGIGVWDRLNGQYADLVAQQGGDRLISAGRVLGVAAIVGAVNSLLLAVGMSVAAFVYNVAAELVGGIEVTLSERD